MDTIFADQCEIPTTEAWTKGLTSTPMLETRMPSTMTSAQPEMTNKNFPSPNLNHLPSSSPPLPTNLIYILLALTVLLSLLLILATFAFFRLFCRRESNVKPPHLLLMQVAPSSSSHNGQFASLAPHHQVQHFPQLLTIADLARQESRQERVINSDKFDSYGYIA